MEKLEFNVVLKSAMGLPGVKIDRESFLNTELRKYVSQEAVESAVRTSPYNAGIEPRTIDKIAENCIAYETNKVTAISFATGLPGGIAMFGTVPADVAQYFGHLLRILQKLVYLYDWEDLFDSQSGMDDETVNLLTLFVGVMFGVRGGAASVLGKVAEKAGERTYRVIVSKALTKGTIYPVIKKIAQQLGIKMTKDIFAKNVSKLVPVIGGVASGGLTYATFRPMAMRLYKYLKELSENLHR